MKQLTVFKRRDTGRITRAAVLLAAAGALLAAGTAFAVSQTIVGTGADVYTAGSYTSDQGDVVPFQVTGSTHNVTASANGPDGHALFRSATISGGGTPVNGTQYLSAGSYQFICTVHPSMVATLVVSANGTPAPRPHVDLVVASKQLAKVAKKGLLVQATSSEKIDGFSLQAKLGKTVLGKATGLSLAAGKALETIRLSKAGKNKLKNLSKASITVTADVPFGAPATAKAKLK